MTEMKPGKEHVHPTPAMLISPFCYGRYLQANTGPQGLPWH